MFSLKQQRMICDECAKAKRCIISKLSQEELVQAGRYLRPLRFEARKPIIHAELPLMPGYYILCHGVGLRVTVLPEGKRLVTQILEEGHIAAFSADPQGRYNTYLEALTDTQLVFIDEKDFEGLFNAHPSLAMQVIVQAREQLHALQWELLTAVYKGSKVRMASLILKLHRIGVLKTVPFRQEMLAEMVGVSREMANKHLHELVGRRVIRIKNHLISVTNMQALEELARDGVPV